MPKKFLEKIRSALALLWYSASIHGVTDTRPELWDREALDLLRSLVSLQTVRDARRFIRDLMTEDEIRMIVERWRVARLLHQGVSYREIERQTGASSRTIARISHWLRSGEGGYRQMLSRAESTDTERSR